MNRWIWLSIYAVASALEFLAQWVKEHASEHIKGKKPPEEPPKP